MIKRSTFLFLFVCVTAHAGQGTGDVGSGTVIPAEKIQQSDFSQISPELQGTYVLQKEETNNKNYGNCDRDVEVAFNIPGNHREEILPVVLRPIGVRESFGQPTRYTLKPLAVWQANDHAFDSSCKEASYKIGTYYVGETETCSGESDLFTDFFDKHVKRTNVASLNYNPKTKAMVFTVANKNNFGGSLKKTRCTFKKINDEFDRYGI